MIVFAHTKFGFVPTQGGGIRPPWSERVFQIPVQIGLNNVGLLRISESVRAYAYLILSSQASARSIIVGNTASALTA